MIESIFCTPAMRSATLSTTRQLSSSVKQSHPDIPWKSIAGMRDKLIHDYFGINLELVWDVVERHLPPLQNKINQLLEDMSEPR